MAGISKKSVIQFVVLLGIGVLLVWLSLKQVAPQKDNIINAFKNANYFWIGVSMVIAVISHFLRAYRWNYLLKPVGYRTNLLNATCHVFVGYLANYGIPRMGEITRCSLATKYDKVPFEVGFGTVITERIIDFLLFLVIFAITLLVQFNQLIGLANEFVFNKVREKFSGISADPMKMILIAALVVFLGLAFVFLRKKFSALLKGKFGGIIKGMAEGIGSVRKMENPWKFIVLSLSIWVCYFYSLYFCFFALEGTSHLGLKECLTLLLLGTFGVMFSPGGLGAYPLILYGILVNTYHVDEVSSFALPWLTWTSQFILIVVAGVLSLIVLPLYNRKKMTFHQQLRNKIVTKEKVLGRIISLHQTGKKVVFTNGCFDILHPGHVDYLSQARDSGDFLILGLNTDASVKLLNKAPNRPVNNEQTRAMVLAGLASIDAIVFFDEETPYDLISFLKPDVLVKGDDYQVENIVGYDVVKNNGGSVITIPFLSGYSTTKLIEKILS